MDKRAKVLYMDKKGLERLDSEINSLKEKLRVVKDFSDSNSTDRYNVEFEENARTASIILTKLNLLLDARRRAVVIEKQHDENLIDIDDIISVDITVGGKTTESTFKLVGGTGSFNTEIPEISVNSPLGSAVYKKSIGDECAYRVNNNELKALIKSKMILETTMDEPTLK